ncbi:MAG TPA: hypothetical protein VM140_04775 [Burkholderiales bacterium]|nr:hypothetical protein [Burkholderiales bacterium]
MRQAILILGLLVFGPLGAQEAKKKAPAKKQAAHGKATPEQIRKFKQLEAKQKK